MHYEVQDDEQIIRGCMTYRMTTMSTDSSKIERIRFPNP